MPEKSLDGLVDHIEQALVDWRMPGAAVAIVSGDEIRHARGHGIKESGADDPVDEHTLFEIGSTSKAFTATAMGILVDDGLVRWDDPIVAHVPEFRVCDPWLTERITIRDALAHRAGFIDFWSPGLEIMDTREALRRMRHQTAVGPFRDSFNYSNMMYGAAGLVIEAASGRSWGEFLRTRLFEPLGMARSRTSPYELWDEKHVAPTFFGTAPAGAVTGTDALDGNVAMPHTLIDGVTRGIPWQSYDFMPAAGAVVSSAADLCGWLVLQLNEGVAHGRRLVRADTMADIHGPQNWKSVGAFPFDADASAYAMGWNRGRYGGRTHLSHGGGMMGFQSYVALLPDERLGVAVLSNADDSTEEAAACGYDSFSFHKCVSLEVFDRLTGSASRDWPAEFAARADASRRRHRAREERLRAARRPESGPTLALADYAGHYADRTGLHGPVRVNFDGATLTLVNPGAGAFTGELVHWHGDLFRLESTGVRYVSPFVNLVVGPDGHVESMSAFDGDFRPLPTPVGVE